MHLLDLEKDIIPKIIKHLPFPADTSFPDMVKKHTTQIEKPNYIPFVKDLQLFIEQQQRENLLEISKENVPPEILKSAVLFNIKSNDEIYSDNSSIRQRIPKGLCILKMNSHDDDDDIVIYADRKCTGTNVNDDDSGDIDFNKYFLKRYCYTHRIITLPEIDGDAFHFSVRFINDKFYLIVGNQNNHMLLGERNDIRYYTKDEYKTTRNFAAALFDQLAEMDDDKRELLYNFLYHTKTTFLCQFIQGDAQHIVEYFVISRRIVFLTLTSHNQQESLTPFSVLIIERIIRFFLRLNTIYIDTSQHDGHFSIYELRDSIRRKNYLMRGKVLYCEDVDGNTIGMIKIKTIKYICLRALREITLRILKQQQKILSWKKLVKCKYNEILSEFNLSKFYIDIWVYNGINFIKWIKNNMHCTKYGQIAYITNEQIISQFPSIWDEFRFSNYVHARYIDFPDLESINIRFISKMMDPLLPEMIDPLLPKSILSYSK